MFSKLSALYVTLLFAMFVVAASAPNRLPRDIFEEALDDAESDTDTGLEVTEGAVDEGFALASIVDPFKAW
ncbi:hypothetical protein V8D89_010454 [Ganoderma adspersum]